MRVVVAGPGALGTCYAALLAQAGAEVTVLSRPARVEQLSQGLEVSGLANVRVKVRVVTRGEDAGQADYLLLTTKVKDTQGALDALGELRVGTALSLQNGARKNDALVQRYGAERVVGGACVVGAGLPAPGHAELTMNRATWVGELEGGSSERVVRLVAALRAAGFPSWSVPDVRAVEWYKLCALIPGAVVTALSRRVYADVALHPDLSALFVAVMRETFAVPRALGYAIVDPPGAPWQFGQWLQAPDEVALAGLRAIGEAQRAAGQQVRPSMLQDVLAARRTEAEEVLGGLLAAARQAGVALPATETCYRLIRGLEDSFSVEPSR